MVIKYFHSFTFTMLTLLALFGCNNSNHGPLYTIARDPSWYYGNLANKDKQVQGFADELLLKIASTQKFRLKIMTINDAHLLEGLDSKHYAGVLSFLPPDPTNTRSYLFSERLFTIGPVLVVPVSSKISSLTEMTGKVVGIPAGTSGIFNIKNDLKILFTSYDTVLEALNNVATGTIDGAILDLFPAQIYTTGYYSGKLHIATAPLVPEGLHVITSNSKEGHQLIDKINAGMKTALEDGTYKELVKKWDLFLVEN